MNTPRNREGLATLKRLAKRDTPCTHDLSSRSYGNSYEVLKVIDAGQRIELAGWRFGIRPGDYLILQGKGGVGTTRYRVDKIDYKSDPPDMWFALATFAPRQVQP